tara:strand:- start:451 stop:1026 length:576 start_codon:yes stop_codon:yes gene_type:complete
LQNFSVCDINIEKSSTAKSLENKYGIEWAFDQQIHLDTSFEMRACISKPITIKANDIVAIPTGIYAQLLRPDFVIEITSLSSLVFDQGLCIAEGIATFNYHFRNEIWLLIKNNFKEAQTIQPAQKVANFSVKHQPRMVIKYVDQIEEIDSKIQTGKSYIQKIKNKIRGISKKERESIGYSRNDIEDYINGS